MSPVYNVESQYDKPVGGVHSNPNSDDDAAKVKW